MQTYHIHINGIVQGVGFRPMVYLLATSMKLNGTVNNGSDGVHIYFNAIEQTAILFLEEIKENIPAKATIVKVFLHQTAAKVFHNFSIITTNENENKKVLISPDISICSECKMELNDENNRRYRYPFITCTQCGPRYAIINKLPYERHNTSMHQFTMCKNCITEYHDLTNRRFFSQTNSCEDCGVKLSLYDNEEVMISNDNEGVFLQIQKYLEAGKIIAVKNTGGYLLLCDASNINAIKQLRKRKHRPQKPFALLFENIQEVENNFLLCPKEKSLLTSAGAPIVLLSPKKEMTQVIALENIAPGLNRLGVMIPSSALLQLISSDFAKPLIATSANISGSPIIYKNIDAFKFLPVIADYILSHNLEITIPEDDSVMQVSGFKKEKISLRRSRGYAPSFLQYASQKKETILCTGAFLKSSFTLSINGNVFVSQFLGSGERFESQEMYKTSLNYFLKLYDVDSPIIIADKHAGYFSHQYALELAAIYKTKTVFIQHHEAHFAAILAEHNLIKNEEVILGVIWDGTGLGDDKNLWGGEFFKYENNQMLRCYHFDYFPAIAGEKLALEPRIAALCTTNNTWPKYANLKEKFSDIEWNNYQKLMETTNLFSSSVGRIFDAVASLLNICDKQSYEGEAAIYLQVLAEKYIGQNGFVMMESYFKEGSLVDGISTAALMQGIIDDLQKNISSHFIAAKFHYSLVHLIHIVATNLNINKICFSGGVFQNALLVDWIKHAYANKYQLFFHKDLSSNDENISFGQMVYFDNDISSIKQLYHKKSSCQTSNKHNQILSIL